MIMTLVKSWKNRFRFRIRVPKHVREELAKNDNLMAMLEFGIVYIVYEGVAFPICEAPVVTQ